MLVASDIYYMDDLECTLHYVDGSSEDFIIEAPSGDGMFKIILEPLGEHIYRDKNNRHRKGSMDYRIRLSFDYSSHMMKLNKLFASDYIDFDFGSIIVPFTNRDFKFDSDTITKKWFAGIPLTADDITMERSNPYPSGDFQAEFISIEPWTYI